MPKTFKMVVDADNVHQLLSPPLYEIVSALFSYFTLTS